MKRFLLALMLGLLPVMLLGACNVGKSNDQGKKSTASQMKSTIASSSLTTKDKNIFNSTEANGSIVGDSTAASEQKGTNSEGNKELSISSTCGITSTMSRITTATSATEGSIGETTSSARSGSSVTTSITGRYQDEDGWTDEWYYPKNYAR